MYKVFVRLPLGVAVVVLVLITKSKLFGILSLDLLVGHCLTLTLFGGGGTISATIPLIPMVIHNGYIPHLVH